MMRLLLCVLLCLVGLHALGAEQPKDAAAQQQEADALLADVDNAPPATIDGPRVLPWYIRVVERPGLYVYLKICKLRDWGDYCSAQARKIAVAVWFYVKNKTGLPREQKTVDDVKGAHV